MRRRRGTTIWVDPKFKKILEEARVKRIENKVDKKLRSFPEITEMALNTPSMDKVLREIETIPKTEDLEKWKLGEL